MALELPEDVLQQVVGSFPPDGGADVGQRKTPRTSLCAGVRVRRCEGAALSPSIDMGLKDISPGGVCLLHYDRFESGARLVVELPMREDTQPLQVLCSVRYCRQVNEDLLAVGAEFIALWAAEPDAVAA